MGESQDQSSNRSATERANELLDSTVSIVGSLASIVVSRISWLGAYAREEAEDMWAEARSIVRENGPTKLGSTQTGEAEKLEMAPKQSAAPEGEVMGGDYEGMAGRKEEEPVSEQDSEANGKAEDIEATDTARRRAEEWGVDLREVKGTGSGGRITVKDVRKNFEKGR